MTQTPTIPADLQALYRALRERRYLRVGSYDALLLAPEECRPVIEHPAFEAIHAFVLGSHSKTSVGRFLRTLNLRYPAHRITILHLNRYRRWVLSQERDHRGELVLKGQGEGEGRKRGRLNHWRDTREIARSHLLILPPPRLPVQLERVLELIGRAPEPHRKRLSELWRYPRRFPERLEDAPGMEAAMEWLEKKLVEGGGKTCRLEEKHDT